MAYQYFSYPLYFSFQLHTEKKERKEAVLIDCLLHHYCYETVGQMMISQIRELPNNFFASRVNPNAIPLSSEKPERSMILINPFTKKKKI